MHYHTAVTDKLPIDAIYKCSNRALYLSPFMSTDSLIREIMTTDFIHRKIPCDRRKWFGQIPAEYVPDRAGQR